MRHYIYRALQLLCYFVTWFVIGFCGTKAFSAELPSYTFHYRDSSELKITLQAENRCAAYKKAAKMCYNILTGGTAIKSGTYPGESEGLTIIDVCANPINYAP